MSFPHLRISLRERESKFKKTHTSYKNGELMSQQLFQIVGKTSDSEIATVYLAKTKKNKFIEFVESTQPPFPREEKWVLIVSTLFGCPVGCPMCDAGGWYEGKVSKEEILAQIDYLVMQRFPDKKIPSKKFKIQFARMGEPAFNMDVLAALRELPSLYDAKGLMPSISTVAPQNCDKFFDELLHLKNDCYSNGQFQLQFSIHTTCQELREKIIPIKKWDFAKIASYGDKFYTKQDRKIVLNFALEKNSPLCCDTLKKHFDPAKFLIKITPINPTIKASMNNIKSYFTDGNVEEDYLKIVESLKNIGFDVILSIGELKENEIGSNCGQYIRRFLTTGKIDNCDTMYTYDIEED